MATTEKTYEITYDLIGGGARMVTLQSREEAENLAKEKRSIGSLYKFVELECDASGCVINRTILYKG